MHLHKRIRYEIVNRKNLILARNFQGTIQKVSFYVLDLQKIVKSVCPEYFFCSDSQTKMDDDYPHLMFEPKVCEHILKQVINNLNAKSGKNAFKWLVLCIIGCALDTILNDNNIIPDENCLQFQMLGFFLMYKIQKNTIPIPSETRLFTTSVMREYLNLFVTIFLEYSNDENDKILIEKLGTTHLEHFFALVRRNCYQDDHLISVANSLERIVALRVIQESDEMTWFNTVKRRKIKEPINKKQYKWDWTLASRTFILSEDIFEACMFAEQDDYKLPIYILNDICVILTGKSINENYQKSNDDGNNLPLELYSISFKEFQNKGFMAKARYFAKSNLISTGSQNTTRQKKLKNNIKTNRLQENCYYGPAFSMEEGDNLCFFNQALQVILHCKNIFKWVNEKSLSQSKQNQQLQIHLFFVGKEYFNFKGKPFIMPKNQAYNSLVDSYLAISHMKFGQMGDITDVILFLLNELKNEKSLNGHKYTSLFEIDIKRFEKINDDQRILKHQIPVLNLSNQARVDISKYHEKDIMLPDLKDTEKNYNQWIDLNMKPLNEYQFLPNETHQIKSITEAFISFLYPSTNQIDSFYQQKNNCINFDEIDYCLQTVLSFPKYLFIKIINEYQKNDPEFTIEEKIFFLKIDKNLIEYEIIGIVFFSGHHFYSIHRCWNSREPIWIHYNDPLEPYLFNGFLQEALSYFDLNINNICLLIYQDMQNIY